MSTTGELGFRSNALRCAAIVLLVAAGCWDINMAGAEDNAVKKAATCEIKAISRAADGTVDVECEFTNNTTRDLLLSNDTPVLRWEYNGNETGLAPGEYVPNELAANSYSLLRRSGSRRACVVVDFRIPPKSISDTVAFHAQGKTDASVKFTFKMRILDYSKADEAFTEHDEPFECDAQLEKGRFFSKRARR